MSYLRTTKWKQKIDIESARVKQDYCVGQKGAVKFKSVQQQFAVQYEFRE